MRTIKQYLEAAKARKENGEAGFSLVELIVVVVILGILAAVAIPIFNGIQQKARDNATAAAAANAASQIVAQLANGDTPTAPAPSGNPPEFTYSGIPAAGDDIDSFCITATHKDGGTASSGPNC